MPKLVLRGHIEVADEDLRAVIVALPTHIEFTRQEAGCLRFDVVQDVENKNLFHVHEEFVDRVAFEAHQARVDLSSWGKTARNVTRHYQITEGG